ncbi:BON domain-containing protein [Lentzea xinjiangensis]|uniref:BON domain-containing protein n=1 Tax=Lentzea xinjiangensis TaxID=402600 RepID=UPI0015A5D3CE|nr:BON domain-containing protein [Lentzea xinjiangensis]
MTTADVGCSFEELVRLVLDCGGELVGVLSRRDLLKLFLHEDDELRTTIRDDVFGRVLWVDQDTVEVAGGVVTLRGALERRSEAEVAEHLVRALPGVVDVRNRLECGWNDTAGIRQTEIFG